MRVHELNSFIFLYKIVTNHCFDIWYIFVIEMLALFAYTFSLWIPIICIKSHFGILTYTNFFLTFVSILWVCTQIHFTNISHTNYFKDLISEMSSLSEHRLDLSSMQCKQNLDWDWHYLVLRLRLKRLFSIPVHKL